MKKAFPAKKSGAVGATIFLRAIIGGMRFGPGKADLLAGIAETGSLAETARRMEMSYMRAWTLLREMQKAMKSPAVILSRGRGKQGGATLTPTGRKVLEAYRELEKSVETGAAKPLRKLAGYFGTAEPSDKG